MMMWSHAVRAGRVRSLGLLLVVLNGCGAQQCQGSAASGNPARSAAVSRSPLPVAPAAIAAVESPPAPTTALAPSGGEGPEAAAEEGSGSADEGSGIPPGMPEEGSPAYERLVARLCARLASDSCEDAQGIWVNGGAGGVPREFQLTWSGGTGVGGMSRTWTEQPDGTWQGPDEKVEEREVSTPSIAILNPEVERTARHPSEQEIAAAQAELTQQRVSCRGGGHAKKEEFIDLNHDGQTECVGWQWVEAYRAEVPTVYERGPDGRWAEDRAGEGSYFIWQEQTE